MDKNKITKILQEIGLSNNESRVFGALLQIKKGQITPIARLAGVNRTSCYDVLEYLNKKGLVLKYIENGKMGYTTEGPQKLKNWLTQKENKLEKHKDALKQNLSELKYIFQSKEHTPKFRYFEGWDMLENFFNDSLECLSGEISGYVATQLTGNKASSAYIKKYVKIRALRKINGRFFIQQQDLDSSRKYMNKYYGKYLSNNPKLARIKILPTNEKKHLLNETLIYDNKVAISHTFKDFFGVIIEDESVATTQRMVFNALWKSVKKEVEFV